MVSRDNNLKTIADFKGKEIAMPFRSDMPDIIFSKLAEESGLDPKKDFKIRYVSNPLDAMQLLINMLSNALAKNIRKQRNGALITLMKQEKLLQIVLKC